MDTLYKLTTQDNLTRKGYPNETQWGENISHSGTGIGKLCGPGWIHAYTSPLLAVILNPIHANISNPKLWESRGKVILSDHGLKVGCKTLTTVRLINLPKISPTQRTAFSILCAREVYGEITWNKWAEEWLLNKNRCSASAYASAYYAYAPSYASCDAIARAAAARAASRAAARACDTYSAASVASVASVASTFENVGANELDFIKLANEAMKYT